MVGVRLGEGVWLGVGVALSVARPVGRAVLVAGPEGSGEGLPPPPLPPLPVAAAEALPGLEAEGLPLAAGLAEALPVAASALPEGVGVAGRVCVGTAGAVGLAEAVPSPVAKPVARAVAEAVAGALAVAVLQAAAVALLAPLALALLEALPLPAALPVPALGLRLPCLPLEGLPRAVPAALALVERLGQLEREGRGLGERLALALVEAHPPLLTDSVGVAGAEGEMLLLLLGPATLPVALTHTVGRPVGGRVALELPLTVRRALLLAGALALPRRLAVLPLPLLGVGGVLRVGSCAEGEAVLLLLPPVTFRAAAPALGVRVEAREGVTVALPSAEALPPTPPSPPPPPPPPPPLALLPALALAQL